MSKSKRAWLTALVSGLLTVAVSMGYLDTSMAAVIATMVTAWIVGDTVRPSGTKGLMGAGGPITTGK